MVYTQLIDKWRHTDGRIGYYLFKREPITLAFSRNYYKLVVISWDKKQNLTLSDRHMEGQTLGRNWHDKKEMSWYLSWYLGVIKSSDMKKKLTARDGQNDRQTQGRTASMMDLYNPWRTDGRTKWAIEEPRSETQ